MLKFFVYKVSLIIPRRTVVISNNWFFQPARSQECIRPRALFLLSTFECYPPLLPTFSIKRSVHKKVFGGVPHYNYTTDSKSDINNSAETIQENQLGVAKHVDKGNLPRKLYENFRESIKGGDANVVTCSYQQLHNSEERVHLTLEDYGEAISILQRSTFDGTLDLLYRMMEDMRRLGLQPGHREYHALIYACGLHGRPSDSWRILDMMRDDGITHSDLTYNTLIEVFKRTLDLESALQAHRRMQTNGVNPNSTIYNSLIDLCCKKGDTENAGKLYREMIEVDVSPDVTTFDILLNGYNDSGNIEKVKEFRQEIMNSKGIKLYDDESTDMKNILNLLLEVDLKHGNMEGVMESFRRMLDGGMKPNSTIQSAIIRGLVKSGNIDKAVELFQHLPIRESSTEQNFRTLKNFFHEFRDELILARGFLQELIGRNLTIGDNVYNALISIHIEKLDIDGAIETYNVLINQGGTINVITFTNLTKTMILSGRENDAIQFYYEVKQTGVELDVQGYTTLIDSFVKMRRIAEAQRLFSDMLRSKVKPNVKTYTVLITGLGQQYDYEGVKNIHSIVKMDLNVDMDVGIYNALMDAYNRCGHVLQVLAIWDFLIASEQSINDSTVSIVLDSCGYGREIRRLVRIWNDLRAKKFPLTLNNYNSLIEALARNQLFEEAKYILFNELISEGFTPEVKTIRPLLNFLHDIPGKSRDEYQVIEWVRTRYPRLAKEMKFTNYKK
ncbi:2796_t:CDS:1 [Acaulospora colombiana]|uniref:2796_t:CDS:1 n=1 Tax=Acaulospora colombiana TaxID=27376 RepID=A0ACA9MQ56_9GLOM|nr:2796_t:CDS:1 [Acaulospora colombiana]